MCGDINANAHFFDFYLPNADFLREVTGDADLETIKTALHCDSFKAVIGSDWSIEFFTTQQALNWLKPEAQNRGSMITLKIRLFQTNQPSIKIQDLLSTSLTDSSNLLSDLCLMLFYVNGGYIKPIYAIAKKFVDVGADRIKTEDIALLAEAPLIAPQEELGQGCIRHFGMKDFLDFDFVQCFATFQRMLQTPHWREKWIVLLEWYFQAIPRISGRRRNVLLPVVANALGTLLENLARIILLEEGTFSNCQFKKLNLEKRINELHNRLGILGDNLMVNNFVAIRNNSTHAKSTALSLTDIQQWEVVWKSVQWVDEIVLWRLGYGGQYRERNLYSTQGIQPRYDLARRNSSW